MKRFVAVIENAEGLVVGAQTDAGPLFLPEGERFPRSELATKAGALAVAFGIDPASFTLPEPTPAPAGNDSTPQGAD